VKLALMASIAAAACQTAYASGQPARPTISVPVIRLRPGGESFTVFSGMNDSARIVVRDSAAWRRAWETIHRPFIPAPPVPRIDFERDMIVVAALGRRPTEGYGVVIEEATQDTSGMEIVVRKTSPGAGCLTPAAVTQPVDVARLPASDQPVRFRERNVVVPCGVR
jgi:hypothetical protein